MLRKLVKQIRVEMEQMRILMDQFSPLLEKCHTYAPTEIEIYAIAACLHSFYNGIENIFKRVSIEADGVSPRGEFWHVSLMNAMVQPTPQRPAVISEELRNRLRDYLDFRHRFRHAYPFELKWHRMESLTLNLDDTYRRFKEEIQAFLSAIEPES